MLMKQPGSVKKRVPSLEQEKINKSLFASKETEKTKAGSAVLPPSLRLSMESQVCTSIMLRKNR